MNCFWQWLDNEQLQNNTVVSSNPFLHHSGCTAGLPGHPGGCDVGGQPRTHTAVGPPISLPPVVPQTNMAMKISVSVNDMLLFPKCIISFFSRDNGVVVVKQRQGRPCSSLPFWAVWMPCLLFKQGNTMTMRDSGMHLYWFLLLDRPFDWLVDVVRLPQHYKTISNKNVISSQNLLKLQETSNCHYSLNILFGEKI